MDTIRTRPLTKEYSEGYDRVFRKCPPHDWESVAIDQGHYGFQQCRKCGKIDDSDDLPGHKGP